MTGGATYEAPKADGSMGSGRGTGSMVTGTMGTMGTMGVTATGTMQGTMQGFGTPIGAAAATAMAFGITTEQAANLAVLTTFVPSNQHAGDVNRLVGNSHGLYKGLAFLTYLRYIGEANRRKMNCQDLMASSLTTILPLSTTGDYIRLDHKNRLQYGRPTETVEHLDFVMLGTSLRSIQGLQEGEVVLLLNDTQARTLIWEVPHRPGTYRAPMKLLDLRCDSCTTVPREHQVDVVFCRLGNLFCHPLGSSRCRRSINLTVHGSHISFVFYDQFDCQLYAVDRSDLRLIFRFDAWLESQKVIKLTVPHHRSFRPAEVATLDNILLVTSAQFGACAVVDKKRHHVMQLVDLHSEEIISDEPIIKQIGKGLATDPDLGILFVGCVTNINQSSISVMYLDEDINRLVDLATIMSPCQPKCMAFYRQQGLLIILDEQDCKMLHLLYLNYDLLKVRLEEQKSHDKAIRLHLSGFGGRTQHSSGGGALDARATAHFVPSRVFPVVLDPVDDDCG